MCTGHGLAKTLCFSMAHERSTVNLVSARGTRRVPLHSNLTLLSSCSECKRNLDFSSRISISREILEISNFLENLEPQRTYVSHYVFDL